MLIFSESTIPSFKSLLGILRSISNSVPAYSAKIQKRMLAANGARTVVLEPRLTRLDGAALEILEDVEISLQPKVKILAELLVIQQNGTSGLLD